MANARSEWKLVGAAGYLTAVNLLIPNIQPLIFGSLANDYHLSDRQLGLIGSAFVLGTVASTLSAPLWIRRIRWKSFSALMMTGAALLLALGPVAHSYAALLLLFAAIGVMKGLFGTPSVRPHSATAQTPSAPIRSRWRCRWRSRRRSQP